MIVNWQKPQVHEGQILNGFQVYITGNDNEIHESSTCKPLSSEVSCQILMTDLIKEPYNLQCGDHIAVSIQSHNGLWSELSKPNTLGTTVKV